MICHARIILPRTIHLSKRLVISSKPHWLQLIMWPMISTETRARESFFKNHMSRDFEITHSLVGWMDDEFLPSWLVACYGTRGCHIFNNVDG
jgi:hypothetical protein